VLDRRRLLLGGAALAVFRPHAAASDPTTSDGIRRVLHRVTYGPSPGDVERVAGRGLGGYLEEQLAPASIPDWKARILVRRIEVLSFDAPDLFLFAGPEVLGALRKATLLRARYSERQLAERLVELWSDHLNVFAGKGDGAWLKLVDDRETLRPHVLGRFRDLLRASLTSPAMLVYLDGTANVAGKPNENHARELLELHTLGVAGGYAQRDVMELARALTGWKVSRGPFRRHLVTFDPEAHDGGPKTVLGARIAPTGERELDAVVDLLAAHPSTAAFVAGKLCRRFHGPDAPSSLVARVEGAFRRSGGDLCATVSTLVHSPELHDAPPRFLRPYDWTLRVLRGLDARTDGGLALQSALEKMGQAPFGWPTPDGYPESEAAWSATVLARWRVALALANGDVRGTRLPSDAFDDPIATAAWLLGRPLAREERAAFRGVAGSAALALALSHPEVQYA